MNTLLMTLHDIHLYCHYNLLLIATDSIDRDDYTQIELSAHLVYQYCYQWKTASHHLYKQRKNQ